MVQFGAFELINRVDDILPLSEMPRLGVFSQDEFEITEKFVGLVDLAAENTNEDMFEAEFFTSSTPWENLLAFSTDALKVFAIRGKFSEEFEAPDLV
jgi:hypothetical protein